MEQITMTPTEFQSNFQPVALQAEIKYDFKVKHGKVYITAKEIDLAYIGYSNKNATA